MLRSWAGTLAFLSMSLLVAGGGFLAFGSGFVRSVAFMVMILAPVVATVELLLRLAGRSGTGGLVARLAVLAGAYGIATIFAGRLWDKALIASFVVVAVNGAAEILRRCRREKRSS